MKGCIPAFTHDDFPRYGYSSQDIEDVKKAGLTGFTVYRSEGWYWRYFSRRIRRMAL
ncbi:conserved hypothetical protein [Escherichia coli M605]|nr:conserved hypothetical protein [Escherichia coli M605]